MDCQSTSCVLPASPDKSCRMTLGSEARKAIMGQVILLRAMRKQTIASNLAPAQQFVTLPNLPD